MRVYVYVVGWVKCFYNDLSGKKKKGKKKDEQEKSLKITIE